MEDFASSHFVITSIKIQIDALKKTLPVEATLLSAEHGFAARAAWKIFL